MITSMDRVYIEIILFSIVTRDHLFVKCLLNRSSAKNVVN